MKNSNNKPETQEQELKESLDHFPIVGIGASAGGLDALKNFFSNLPNERNIAYIVVQHLDPNHESNLDEILTRFTSLNVVQAIESIDIEPNTIYVISPGHKLSINDTRIKVDNFTAQRGQRKPIDFLFRSMAYEFEDKSIGILLSGTGTDGTLGLREIKGVNGIAIVQDPDTAEYEDMPRNAINNLKIDFILPPEKIPEKLAEYIDSYYKELEERKNFKEVEIKRGLNIIFDLVHRRTGHQFSAYKESTILRRIKKRMGVNQIYEFTKYVEYLQSKPNEADNLFQEFLIGVTNFFRDKESFEILEKKVIPKLFDYYSSDETIRVWVPGCSTGEEAYSIAILLQEYKKENNLANKIQIFATDIDTQAIEVARRGSYLDNISVDISKERLDRFFTSRGNQYQIKKSIRNIIIFAKQNVLSDPP